MKRTYLATIFILAGAAFFVYTYTREGKQSNERPAQTLQPSTSPISALETQTNSDGPVTLKATPKFSSEIAFEITLDTHSEELNANLTQTAMLIDENGKEYKPLRWEGDPPGGHHREGILKFKPISPQPKTITLKISRIGGVPERKFLWTIQP